MAMRKLTVKFTAAVLLAGGTALAQVPAAVPGTAGPTTLWNFLGIPQGLAKMGTLRNGLLNRRGNFPGLEKKPPLKGLADPSNLKSKNPAIKKAAEIKAQDDEAKQKIKALKYLAKMGCGYDGVKEALMAALDDPNEKVRLTAAEQILKVAEDKCAYCSKSCCCDEEMSAKLFSVAFDRDEKGCFVEPSEEVRETAAEAMRACCAAHPNRGGVTVPSGGGERSRVPQPQGERGAGTPYEETPPMPPSSEPASPDDKATDAFHPSNAPYLAVEPSQKQVQQALPAAQRSAPAETPTKPVSGRVVAVDYKTGTADLEFSSRVLPAPGSRIKVRRQYAFELASIGEMEVVFVAKTGRVIAQASGRLKIADVAKGDQAIGRVSDESRRAAPVQDRVTQKPAAAPTKSAATSKPSAPVKNAALQPAAPTSPLERIEHGSKVAKVGQGGTLGKVNHGVKVERSEQGVKRAEAAVASNAEKPADSRTWQDAEKPVPALQKPNVKKTDKEPAHPLTTLARLPAPSQRATHVTALDKAAKAPILDGPATHSISESPVKPSLPGVPAKPAIVSAPAEPTVEGYKASPMLARLPAPTTVKNCPPAAADMHSTKAANTRRDVLARLPDPKRLDPKTVKHLPAGEEPARQNLTPRDAVLLKSGRQESQPGQGIEVSDASEAEPAGGGAVIHD